MFTNVANCMKQSFKTSSDWTFHRWNIVNLMNVFPHGNRENSHQSAVITKPILTSATSLIGKIPVAWKIIKIIKGIQLPK